LLSIENFSLTLKGSDNRSLPVLEDINLELGSNSCLGIAGESGSGKSVLAMSVVGLIPSKSIENCSGILRFKGVDLLGADEEQLRKIRGRKIGFIFQEPMTAMNPLMTLFDQIAEGITAHEPAIARQELQDRVERALLRAGFSEPEKFYGSYPHQLSGGMRQRAMIAIGLAMDPDIVIADEPTTAIDAGLQVQLLKELKSNLTAEDRAMIFISHDLGVLRSISNRLAILYAGNLVESGDTKAIMENPHHPYTRDLIAALPRLVAERHLPRPIPGNLPLPDQKPGGCVYSDRCHEKREKCLEARPTLREVAPGRFARCFFPVNIGAGNGD
jgi:oligopeptide/dipeptide ABC transporter ATP-binding protein